MAGPRPRRRPLVLVLFAGALTAIVLLSQSGGSSHPNQAEAVQVYLDQVHPGVQSSTTDGADFADIRSNAAKLGRDGIDRRLDRLARSVDTTLGDVDALTPPASMRVPHAYLVAALGVRSKAVHAARDAFDTALTLSTSADQGTQDAVDRLTGVGQDLTLGDRAFALFLGALPHTVAAPPPSVWVANPSDWSSSELPAFVTSLRSSASLSAVHDLSMIAFQTDPPAVSTLGDGTEVVPTSKAMSVSMVIENVGNQPEHNVTVSALLTLANGSQQSLRDFIDLAPGQRRAITLSALHPPSATNGTLQVIVQPVPGETNLKNNTIVSPMQFR